MADCVVANSSAGLVGKTLVVKSGTPAAGQFAKFTDANTIQGVSASAAAGITNLVVAGSDEAVTSSTTLQDDDAILFAVEASSVYWFECMLGFDSSTNPGVGVKFRFTLPSGATMTWFIQGFYSTTNANLFNGMVYNESSPTTTVTATVITSANGGTAVILRGIVRTTGAGTVTLQWAQGVSSGTALTRKKDSFIAVTKQ